VRQESRFLDSGKGERRRPFDPPPTVRRWGGGNVLPFHHAGALPMTTTASWYHCSVKVVSRSAGRSVVAAAAYRLGERLADERYAQVHDYRRRGGVLDAFTLAPEDAPEWAHDPERLWNAAEAAEKHINSCVAREVELALPAFLSRAEQHNITERFAGELIDRYGVAVSVAIHAPGKGDDRNYHAHIMFTTREMQPDGLGKKTRILDDRKTGAEEVVKLRALAATIINDALAAAHSDIRVDHRSFKERGIEREPTEHLGPAASEMERRGEESDRGDRNREVERINDEMGEAQAERDALDTAIEEERQRPSEPPADRAEAQQRIRDNARPFIEAIQMRGAVADIQSGDGLKWWQRPLLHLMQRTVTFAHTLADKAQTLWRDYVRDGPQEPSRDDRERERER